MKHKLLEFLGISRERTINQTVNGIVNKIAFNHENFTQSEQTEILNRVTLRIFEMKREKRGELLREARELQQSLIDIKI